MNSRFITGNFINARTVLIIVILFHCINNLFWFKNDSYFLPGAHSVWLEEQSFAYSDILIDRKMPILKKIKTTFDFFKLSHSGYTLSATNFNLTSFFIAFPIAAHLNGYTKLFLINTFLFFQFLLVLFSVYYLGKIIFNQIIGAWSAIILSFYPGIVGLSRKMSSELPATFFVIISIIIFIRWKHLPINFRSLLLLFVFCLGTLSGAIFLAFFIPLFLLHIFFISYSHEKDKQNLKEIFAFLLLILIFLHFYFNGEYLRVFSNLKESFHDAFKNLILHSGNWVGSAAQGIIEFFLFAPQDAICPCTQTINVGLNIKTFLFYIMEMMYYASPIFFLLAFLSLFFLFRDKRMDFYKRMFFGMWLVFGYLLLSLFHIKWGKFITPVLPVLALSSSIFICDYSKKIKITKIIILCIGISTVIYYSFFAVSSKCYLEILRENIVSYRPVKSRFVEVAERTATWIDNDGDNSSKPVNIIFLDKESVRLKGQGWVTDTSLRLNHLIRIFLRKKHRMDIFWRLSDDFYNSLYKGHFVILITHNKLKEIENYLHREKRKEDTDIKLETICEEQLKKDIFIYLIKVQNKVLINVYII